MINQKRGLSTVVATFIIILLVIVAIGAVWVVVDNLIESGTEQIELGKFTLNLEIQSVQVVDSDTLRVKVKRNTGAGEISGLSFIFDDGDNTEIVELKNTTMKELQETTYTLDLVTGVSATSVEKVSVAPIFRLSSGKDVVGDVKDEYDVTPTTSGTGGGGTGNGGSQISQCGNGTVDSGEACDDSNTQNGDGCSSSCTVESGWSCTGEPSSCSEIDTAQCGDGTIQSSNGEQCDDGETSTGDGCDDQCQIESGWSCTGEPSSCTEDVVCGDGVIEGDETCDDSNTEDGDGCGSTCLIESGYSCTGEPSTCTQDATCGDGTIDSGEECDDDGTQNGDGCSSSCTIESGYSCTGEPSVCSENQCSNVINNGGFDSGTTSWTSFSDGDATFAVNSNGGQTGDSAEFTINAPGTNVQLYQFTFSLYPNTEYILSFDAYSNTGRDMDVLVHEHDDDFTNYGLNNQVSLTSSSQNFEFTFTTTGFSSEVNDARLRFWFSDYDQSGDIYYIDNVELREVDSSGVCDGA